jgi:hypothetical protein
MLKEYPITSNTSRQGLRIGYTFYFVYEFPYFSIKCQHSGQKIIKCNIFTLQKKAAGGAKGGDKGGGENGGKKGVFYVMNCPLARVHHIAYIFLTSSPYCLKYLSFSCYRYTGSPPPFPKCLYYF